MSVESDKILVKYANKYMTYFDLDGFKKSHNKLHMAITASLDEAIRSTIVRHMEHCLALGISIKFSRDINQFVIELQKEEQIETVHLPFDHLNEYKISKYINLMLEKFKQ